MDSLVESATSDVRMGLVDFGVNLEICDSLSRDASQAGALVEAANKRLKSRDANVQALTLTLLEMCVKNCGAPVHAAVETGALEAVMKAAEGRTAAATQALGLVQQWGMAFDATRYPAYARAYGTLRMKGLPFPDESAVEQLEFEEPAPANEMAAGVPDDASFAAALADGTVERANALAKVRADLDVVAEHVAVCEQMIPESPGIAQDDALSEVVGFLEACRPRLAALVEAGLAGALGDETLTRTLEVNDLVHKALEHEATGNTYAAPTLPAAAPAYTPPVPTAAPAILDDEEDDAPLAPTYAAQYDRPPAAAEPNLLDLGMPPAAPPAAAPADPFDPFASASVSAPAAPPPAPLL